MLVDDEKWKATGKVKVLDEVHEVQQLSPTSYVARTTRIGTESAELIEPSGKATSPKGKKKKYVSSLKSSVHDHNLIKGSIRYA